MIYRKLGRTGLEVSQLGFGAMRLPQIGEGDEARVNDELAVPLMRRAFEAGVNYIDTAVMYCRHDGQRAVGEALKGWRDRVIVSTKNHYYGEDEKAWWKNLEDSLRLLQVDCIDVYHHHGISRKRWTDALLPRVSRWTEKARDRGLVRHVACSFHDENDLLMEMIDSGYPEVITLQYNMLDRRLTEGIAHAHEKGVGIAVMGPVGGGRLAGSSDVLEGVVPGTERLPSLALRFVLSNPGVSVALSGVTEVAQLEENLRTASDGAPLSAQDRAALSEHLDRLKGMADLYCTGCKYCMPCEAADVNIPVVFELYNRGRVYGLWDSARRTYARLGKGRWPRGNPADACTECGACEDKCPQKLPIRAQLKEAHQALKAPDK